MASLLCNRGSIIVTSGLKFKVIQPHFFENGIVLVRRYEALSFGGVRGIRGSRLMDPEARGSRMAFSPGIKIMKGEDLLRELEREHKQLRRSELSNSKDTVVGETVHRSKTESFHSNLNKNEKRKQQQQLRGSEMSTSKAAFAAENAPRPKKENFPSKLHMQGDFQPKIYTKSNFIRDENSKFAERRNSGKEEQKKLQQKTASSELPITVSVENQFQLVNDIICPLLEVPYEEQLAIKTKKHEEFLSRLLRLAPSSANAKIGKIIPSEILTEYRSTDEFGIQKGVDGNSKTVGFFVGSSKSRLVCVEPRHIPIIKNAHVKVAAAFQDYIRKSDLPAHLDMNDQGYWRGLIVRSDIESRHIMVTVILRPHYLTEKKLEIEKAKLGQYFREAPGLEVGVTSLFLQQYPVDLGGGKKSDCELIFGEPKIQMELFGRTFEVGPQTFFPTNLSAAEKLLRYVRPFCNVSTSSKKSPNFSQTESNKISLIDVGCGVGINSILSSEKFEHCFGLDVFHDEVKDAKHNANLLNVAGQCSFTAGPYSKTFAEQTRNLENEARFGVVILNSSRIGIDRQLISQIRGCSLIKKVIFISSKPEGEDFSCFRDLCLDVTKESKNNRFSLVPISKRFVLTHTVPIDENPHSTHCKHVLVFSR